MSNIVNLLIVTLTTKERKPAATCHFNQSANLLLLVTLTNECKPATCYLLHVISIATLTKESKQQVVGVEADLEPFE